MRQTSWIVAESHVSLDINIYCKGHFFHSKHFIFLSFLSFYCIGYVVKYHFTLRILLKKTLKRDLERYVIGLFQQTITQNFSLVYEWLNIWKIIYYKTRISRRFFFSICADRKRKEWWNRPRFKSVITFPLWSVLFALDWGHVDMSCTAVQD